MRYRIKNPKKMRVFKIKNLNKLLRKIWLRKEEEDGKRRFKNQNYK